MSRPERIPVSLGKRSYDIILGRGILTEIGEQLEGLELGRRCAVLSDSNLGSTYGRIVADGLSRAGYEAYPLEIPAGEGCKTLAMAGEILRTLVDCGLARDSFLVNVGGGVVGDIGGFVAAIYMRGIPYLHIPTSLMAQVDAMIGGKTGVNLPQGKNLAGAFHQPKRVLVEPGTLNTLPQSELRSGFAEVVKYGVIEDPSLFQFLERNVGGVFAMKDRILDRILSSSCRIKAQVVAQDERESGRRAILNFGHTIGHAVETHAGYGNLLHGEAVAIGMIAAARLSQNLGYMAQEQVERIETLLQNAGLPTDLRPYPAESILEIMNRDKKVKEGKIRFVLAEEIGKVFISSRVRESDLLALWE